MLIITSKKPGFRRCGMAHPAAPIEHPDGTFTPEEIEILKAEPMLVVLEADEEQAELTNTPVAARKMIELVKKAESLDELEAWPPVKAARVYWRPSRPGARSWRPNPCPMPPSTNCCPAG